MDGTVLVADDDRTIRTVLTQALTRAGCKGHATSSLTTLMRWVGEGIGDVVISDVVMPDGNGLEMLPKIAQDRPDLPVIVISAQNTIMTAIKAAEAEAFDYLPKPFDLPDLMKRTAAALERHGRPSQPATAPAAKAPTPSGDLPLIGRSAAMQALYRQVAGMVNDRAPLLITGESGTGKTLLAQSLHDLSDRAAAPIITVAPDALTADSMAGLVERAGQGTIVIEGLEDVPAHAQSSLVRVLDACARGGPRFIATSLGNPEGRLASGDLREDLYYRISALQIALPPLRSRLDDIPLLCDHFLRVAKVPHRLDPDALDLLRQSVWPGNVRQLQHCLNRCILNSSAGPITAQQIRDVLGQGPHQTPQVPNEKLSQSVARHIQRYFDLHDHILPPNGLYQRILREVEAPLIDIALTETGGNQAKCAELLGINRNTLRKKILDLDIEVTRRRKLM
jgi:two-component system nitrogen regulation response regulator GlnG